MHRHLRKLLLILFTIFSLSPLLAQRAADAVQIQKLLSVYRKLAELYVDEVDMAPLTEEAIRGMLEELDPHSAYIDADEMRSVVASFEGGFSGIGIEFRYCAIPSTWSTLLPEVQPSMSASARMTVSYASIRSTP